MNPGKARGQEAVKLKKRKSFGESVPGQRTLDSMLGASPSSIRGFNMPVSKGKDASSLTRGHLRGNEHQRMSSSHSRSKELSLKVSDIRRVKHAPKASADPQRRKEEQPKTPTVKRERAFHKLPHSSPPKRRKFVDLTQSPITKYISPIKRQRASSDQAEKKCSMSPRTNGFVSITDASTRHLCVRSLPSSPVIDLTGSRDCSSPINLCSSSSSTFGSSTSTPKSSSLTSPWERFSISTSDISTSSSAQSGNAGESKSDLLECEDFIPLESPTNAKVASLFHLGRVRTAPVRLYTKANKVMPCRQEVSGAADQMDVSVPNLDGWKCALRLEVEQWCCSSEDLKELAAKRMVHVERASASAPIKVVPLSGCQVKEYLQTSLPFRANLALEEAMPLLSPSSMPSAQVMALLCQKVILAEEPTMLQKRCSNFLHLVLDQCPPGRSEVVRQVYVDTFKHFKQLPQCQEMFGGTMQAMIAMMIPSSPSLLVLQWMNNVLLSDLLTSTHSTSPVSPLVSGLSASLRHVLKATAEAVGSRDERDPVAESLLEECLVTVQLYATHLLLKQENIDSLSKQLSSQLLEAGVDCFSSSLSRIYPMQLRTAVMNHLTAQVAH